MNQIEAVLLLIGLPLALLLAGAWLVALIRPADLSDRLAVGLLAGLNSLLLTVSVVNYFTPIAGPAVAVCLLPVFVSLLWGASRRQLIQDLRALFTSRSAWGWGSLIALSFGLLLWPVLSSATTVMYDGTSNHDSFFWVNVAEHLKRHTYMENPAWSPLQPARWAAEAVVGWHPAWGRMGAEGLMALCSAVIGLSPLKLYLYVTAALLGPWLAATHLVVRAFYADRLAGPAKITVLLCHPIFLFFYNNSNLPNLVGVLTGTTAILAMHQAMQAGWTDRRRLYGWAALLALSLHGVYCSYSEMIPFVVLPCGLLWLQSWTFRSAGPLGPPRLVTAGAVVASLLLNPASTFRAGWGFYAAYLSARTDDRWGSILALLHPAQYLPAMGTLAATSVKWLGFWVGLLLSLLIVAATVLAWRRARHPVGALLAFAGGLALLLYTLAANFVYGWQKSVQFTGVLASALVSGVLVDALWQSRFRPAWTTALLRTATVGLTAFLLFAAGMQYRELYIWSDRKQLSNDWFELRQQSRSSLLDQPVLIEAATFRMAFFHGMWAAYFLNESHLYYGLRGEQTGGYLRQRVIHESTTVLPPPAAILVGRNWAETFDANSPRLLAGTEYTLLRTANRIFELSGVFPLNGPPDAASARIEMEMLPHSPSELILNLRPDLAAYASGDWEATRHAEGTEDLVVHFSGSPSWSLQIPLVSSRRNHLTLRYTGPNQPAPDAMPFKITRLQIQSTP